MTLRRLGLAVPLAILVALLEHLATFGLQHAPAGRHATHLIASVAAALALAAFCTVLLFALRRRGRERRKHGAYVHPLDLALGGALAYAAIECCEGRAPVESGWPLFSLLACAAFVYSAARLAERALRYCGEALAALADRIATSYRARAFFTTARERRLAVRHRPSRATRGRAPPLFA